MRNELHPLRTNWPAVPDDFIPPPEGESPRAKLKGMLAELQAYKDEIERKAVIERHADIFARAEQRERLKTEQAQLALELQACIDAGVFEEDEPEPITDEQLAEMFLAALAEGKVEIEQ